MNHRKIAKTDFRGNIKQYKLIVLRVIGLVIVSSFLLSGFSTTGLSCYEEDCFLDLTYEDKDYFISIAYRAVNDSFSNNSQTYVWPEKFDNVSKKVFIGFRVNGKKKGSWSARKNNLAESVYVATMRTIEDQRYDGSITESDLADLKIAVFILGDYNPLDLDVYEPGIHGLRFEKGSSGATYYNSVAIEGNYATEKLMSKLCKKAGLSEECSDDPSVDKYFFDTIHFATTRWSEDIVTFYRCNLVEFFPNVTLDKTNYSFNLAVNWLIDNVKDDGVFNYRYAPANGRYSTSNNMIRQLMASRMLAELSCKNASLQELHRKNLDYVFTYWYREENDTGYIFFSNKSKIGANGMMLRTLVFSPFFDEYKDEAEKLANGIVSLQNEDGSLEPWFIEPSYSYDKERLLYYYSGQAILSLAEYYEKTGDTAFLDAAVKSQDFYVVEYVDKMNETYYPAMVPWHSISLFKLYNITKNRDYLDAVFVLNDELIKMQNQNGTPYIDYLGRFYDPVHPEYGVPFSGSTAVYVEGLGYAYELAGLVDDIKRQKSYYKSIVLGIHNLINLQFNGSNMYYLQHPERVVGAVRYRVDDNQIRIDTTGHTIDAFSKVLSVFDGDNDGEFDYFYDYAADEVVEVGSYGQDEQFLFFVIGLFVVVVIVILGVLSGKKEPPKSSGKKSRKR